MTHERAFEIVIMNTVIICCRIAYSKYEPSRMMRAIMTGFVIVPIALIRETMAMESGTREIPEVRSRTSIDR